jgi:DNA-binding MarR family transcriptional regulator
MTRTTPDSRALPTTTGRLKFADALVRLTHLVQHVFAEVSRQHDLTPQQTQLLCLLVHRRVGMTELSHTLHLEKSSLTGLVDRVERRGLVTRTRETRDRRTCKISLTGEGTRLAVETHQEVTTRLEALAGELRPAERRQLASLIAQLLV